MDTDTKSAIHVGILLLGMAAALGASLHAPLRERAAPPPAAALEERYQGWLSATDRDAWKARTQLETRLALIEATVAMHGGVMRRGPATYRRIVATHGGVRTDQSIGIDQQITVMMPDTVPWAQLQDDLVRLSHATR